MIDDRRRTAGMNMATLGPPAPWQEDDRMLNPSGYRPIIGTGGRECNPIPIAAELCRAVLHRGQPPPRIGTGAAAALITAPAAS